VVLAHYEPNVRCEGSLSKAAALSCSSLAQSMPAGTDLEYFGDRRQDPRVEEKLPQDLTFGKVLPIPTTVPRNTSGRL